MSPTSKLLVQKYGGSSVGSVERIAAVVARIARDRAAGRDVVAEGVTRTQRWSVLVARGSAGIQKEHGVR